MNTFESFNIKSIHYIGNSISHMLANMSSNNDPTYEKNSIKLICKSSIPDNNERIFGDEQQIMGFIQLELNINGS